MTNNKLNEVNPTFLGAPAGTINDVEANGFAVIGAPYGTPYTMENVAGGASKAPSAIRSYSSRYKSFAGRYDFDLEGPFFDTNDTNLVDLGDCVGTPFELDRHLKTIEETVRQVARKDAMPIILGGDDSTPIPICAGLDTFSDIHILQIDAHLDYRDSVSGNQFGYSSPMRRVREMSHFGKIIHVGARGIGSAYVQDYEDTLAAGNSIVTARVLHKNGVGQVATHFPDGANVYITVDCDGFDPSVMPGTSVPLPGGIEFYEGIDIFKDIARRCHLRGIGFTEHYPDLDVNRITAVAITRIICNVIGALTNNN